jgi:hypothetical protein
MATTTSEGKKTGGMIARREINGISIGYRVLDWKISNEQGNVVEIRMSLGEVDMQILIVPSLRQDPWMCCAARPLAP